MTAAEDAAAARGASVDTAADRAPTRREWIALAVLSIGLGLIVLDGTIVGVALPAIISDLRLDLTDAQWVNSLYAVVLAALLLSTGSLADRLGRKRLFLAGSSCSWAAACSPPSRRVPDRSSAPARCRPSAPR